MPHVSAIVGALMAGWLIMAVMAGTSTICKTLVFYNNCIVVFGCNYVLSVQRSSWLRIGTSGGHL